MCYQATRSAATQDAAYSPDIIDSSIFFKAAGDGWQFAKMVGPAEDAESEMFPHTIKMLDWGKRFNVPLRRDQLKMPDVSSDPATWKMMDKGL